VAFYEENGEVVFYGVRNIARANAARLGLENLARAFQILRKKEDEAVLLVLVRMFLKHGINSRHAEAEECLKFAVSQRLLHPGRREEALGRLHRKYERLYAILDKQPAVAADLATLRPLNGKRVSCFDRDLNND